MGDAQGAAGDQAFLGGTPFRGAHQTPARPLTWPLQQLHRLSHLDGQLTAVASVEVLEDHGQLTSTRELGGDEKMGANQEGMEKGDGWVRGEGEEGWERRGEEQEVEERREMMGFRVERRQKMEKGVGNRKEKKKTVINSATESLHHSSCSHSLESAQS